MARPRSQAAENENGEATEAENGESTEFAPEDREKVAAAYGEFPDATALLVAKEEATDPDEVKAGAKLVDEAATAAVDASSLEAPEGSKVVSHAVRGDRIFVVSEDEAGVVTKSSVPHEGDYNPYDKTKQESTEGDS